MKKKNAQSLPRTALAAALILELSAGAQATTITVDNNNCTLADAIIAANTDSATASCSAGNGNDVIVLPSDSNITLTEALPAIINHVTINANGSILERDSGAAEFSVIQVGSAAYIGNLPTLILNDATVTGGSRANNYGGGINTLNASLILNNCIVTNNIGGGITLSSNNNSAINTTDISFNQSSNSASYYGGALSVNSGLLTISNSTISNNTSNSGLGGAGIYVSNYAGAMTLNIVNSTISGNTATAFDGAGIFHYYFAGLGDSDVVITNSTIVNNQSAGVGGGIYNDGADFVVKQSLISGNSATGAGNEINANGGTFTLNDYNLIGLNNNNGSTGITVGATDIVPGQAKLNEIIDVVLADNGGATATHNLVEGSPAIDAVMIGNCATLNDQTGQLRGNDGDGDMTDGCDIGAVEYQLIVDLIFSDGFDPPLN